MPWVTYVVSWGVSTIREEKSIELDGHFISSLMFLHGDAVEMLFAASGSESDLFKAEYG